MKQAFMYKDEKSSKFWWIDYSGTDFVVNFGKAGSFGRLKLKEFDTEETCEKEVKRLISSKIKKGYKLNNEFDFDTAYYFDDDEVGLHPKTSHPNFVKYFHDDFYFDCGDENAPFGSDEGSDTLSQLEIDIRKHKEMDWSAFPKKLIETYWDMRYIPPTEHLNSEEFSKQLTEQADYERNVYQSDKIIVAVAFSQIKIMGEINEEIKQLALLSLPRITLLAKIKDWGECSKINEQMTADLKAFNNG